MVSDLQAKLRFQGQTKLPRWMGSAFRGGLGHQLKGILCPSIQEECSICSEKEECFYYRVYEVKESKRGHAPPPKPLIVVPPFFGKEMNWRRGGDIHLRILLLGEEGIRHAPHVIFSLIQLGMIGLGSERAYGMNKFRVISVTSQGETIFNGSEMRIPPPSIDVREVDPIEGDRFRVYFRTPYTGRTFPLGPREFLSRTRNRLIRFVNEYGDSSYVEEPEAKGRILRFEKHVHFLRRKSERSGKMTLTGFTGIIDYEFSEIDEVGRWLLGVANLLGLGPDSSFGLGFVKVTRLEDSH